MQELEPIGDRQSDRSTTEGSTVATLPIPLDAIPDHELVRCIGRGSYGEVWLARNMMGIYRAVKIVACESSDRKRLFERELAGIKKFEPVSRSHEGFVDVLHVGHRREVGCFYYIMELGDDVRNGQAINPQDYVPKTLDKEVSLRRRLPVGECVQLGLALTNALHHLHNQGLVHRDIKPSNIIFVNGAPKLADIGLVAEINEAFSYVGTAGFIPPEGPGSPQADIYSLGKVLYEISTGNDRNNFPELPARLDEFSDPKEFLELNEVILQACKTDRRQRYQSAWEMHADLMVLAHGKSVRRLKVLERRLANLKRIASLVVITLVCVSAVVYPFYREWSLAVAARQRNVGANVAYGTRAMEEGDLLGALPSFAEALREDQGDSDRELTHRMRLGAILDQCPKLVQTWSRIGQANTVRFSPDGQDLLIAVGFGNAQVFKVANGKAVSPPFGPAENLVGAAYSPDGRRVVTASFDHSACLWNVEDGKRLSCFQHPDRVFAANFSADGLRVVTACKDRIGRVWEVATGKLILELKGHSDALLYAAFSRDDQRIATASRDGTARIWNSATGALIGLPLRHGSTWVSHANFSPEGGQIITAGMDHKAIVWEVATGRKLLPELRHSDAVSSAEFSPCGRLILTAALDSTVRLWDAQSLQRLSFNHTLRHGSRVLHAAFCPDGRRIATACLDGTVEIWDLAGSSLRPAALPGLPGRDGRRLVVRQNTSVQVFDTASGRSVSPLINFDHPLHQVVLSGDSEFLVTIVGAQPGTGSNHLWLETREVSTGKGRGKPIPLPAMPERVLISRDGGRVAFYGPGKFGVFETLTGDPLFVQVNLEDTPGGADFDPRGEQIAVALGRDVRLWNLPGGTQRLPPLRHTNQVEFVRFSPDGHRLLTGCRDNQFSPCCAQVWEVSNGRPVGQPLRHQDGVIFGAFSRDGRRIVTTSEDFSAIVWDAASGKQLSAPLRHEHQVLEADFSPDGRWVVTSSWDSTARVWDAVSGEPLTPPLSYPGEIWSARFLSDGRSIVTVTRTREACLWTLPMDRRPVADLLSVCQLLSGRPNPPRGTPSIPTPVSRQSVWSGLYAQYPGDFSVSADEKAAWHLSQAALSEKADFWSGAAFHLERSVRLKPEDRSLPLRLAQMRQKAHESTSR